MKTGVPYTLDVDCISLGQLSTINTQTDDQQFGSGNQVLALL